ncbi:claudin-5 [Dendropsophus ebraccatus]|uniref:claudin-5 n=1 Tax=Dendropsophus ebraccatus TaxID=150705 RepID=UPI0038315406
MGAMVLEIFGLSLSIIGWVGVILACALPMWQVTAFIDNQIVTAQFHWEGLWMTCVIQSTGQMQCKVYDSILGLRPEVQAARALTVLAAILGIIALLVTVLGAQCTVCFQGTNVKSRMLLAGGVMYIVDGLLVLIPLCWTANIVIRDFFNPHVPNSNKREMGAALYVGWAATALLLLGGVLICLSSRGQRAMPVKYSASRRPTSNGDYDKKNYV